MPHTMNKNTVLLASSYGICIEKIQQILFYI